LNEVTNQKEVKAMAVYVVAQLKFVDRPTYDKYQAKFMAVFSQSDGRVLVADEHPKLLEGTWDREKIVILSFPSAESAKSFLTSPAYEEIAKDRKAGANAVVFMAEGVPGHAAA
jgi:uncharacterized protein (DUF1330 family)